MLTIGLQTIFLNLSLKNDRMTLEVRSAAPFLKIGRSSFSHTKACAFAYRKSHNRRFPTRTRGTPQYLLYSLISAPFHYRVRIRPMTFRMALANLIPVFQTEQLTTHTACELITNLPKTYVCLAGTPILLRRLCKGGLTGFLTSL